MQFNIPLNPQPKERARKGKWGRFYTPQKTVAMETAIGLYVRTQIGPREPLEGPVKAYMVFHVEMPRSWSKKKKKERMGKPITSRPDLDNYEKLTLDSLNGILYKDDSQVWYKVSSKVWSDSPHIELKITG